MSFPGSWCQAGSGGRPGPSGPAGPRETAPHAGRGSPRRRSALPFVAATAIRRSRSAQRARKLHSPTAARNRQSAGTSFHVGESRGPGLRPSATRAPPGDCTSSTELTSRHFKHRINLPTARRRQVGPRSPPDADCAEPRPTAPHVPRVWSSGSWPTRHPTRSSCQAASSVALVSWGTRRVRCRPGGCAGSGAGSRAGG
jgi:hypothetical protein